MKTALIKQLWIITLAAVAPLTAVASPDFWIDVRSQQEYAESHVTGAINIPHEDIKEQISTITKDKNAEIFLYCRSGRRSGIALKSLQSMEYTNVKNIGGISDALKTEASS